MLFVSLRKTGWNHSRVSDVSLQRVGPNGEVLNSATLIKSNGCINPQMHSICSHPPVFEPPLGHRLSFRAVMFQGMKSGDEMMMTVRIVGCMDHHDCHFVSSFLYGNCVASTNSNVFQFQIQMCCKHKFKYVSITNSNLLIKFKSFVHQFS